MRVMTRALITIIAILANQSDVNAQETIRWSQNLEQAQAEARRQNKPVLVHFWSYSCAPCMKLERYVFNNPEVGAAVSQSVIPVKVNVDQNPDLARNFAIKRIPTDIFLTANGKELQRRTSPGNARNYIELVRTVASTASTVANSGWPEVAQAARDLSGNASNSPNVAPAGSQLPPRNQNSFQNKAAQYVSSPPTNNPRTATSNYGQSPGNGSWDGYGHNQRPTNNAWLSPQNGYRAAAPPSTGQFQGAGPSADRSQMIVNQQFNSSGPPTWQGNAGQSAGVPYGNNMNQPNGGAFVPNSAQGNGQISNPYVPPSRPPGPSTPPPSSPLGYNPSAPATPRTRTPSPARGPKSEFAMEGHCPVTLRESKDASKAWTKGDPRFGAKHRGRTYLFAGPDEQRKFLERPDYYSPVLSCYDPVRFADGNELVEGQRRHGVFYRGQVFLFADEGTLRSFWQNPSRYSSVVYEAMRINSSENQRR